ncbi:hypothetical protein SELMODRAFT_430339 [Selaginella moellendorffii]|uniref:Uncharacterized protein n=1 Tax=Selaginella moellendorffii TaxID=88036 RepID=D8T934_SELML|nr:hypothetical protein SELMODRAFT_430339 [Selaginella moellendorffii]
MDAVANETIPYTPAAAAKHLRLVEKTVYEHSISTGLERESMHLRGSSRVRVQQIEKPNFATSDFHGINTHETEFKTLDASEKSITSYLIKRPYVPTSNSLISQQQILGLAEDGLRKFRKKGKRLFLLRKRCCADATTGQRRPGKIRRRVSNQNYSRLLPVDNSSSDTLKRGTDKLYFITITKNNTRSLKCVNVWDSHGKVATLATWTSLPMGLHQETYNGCRNNNSSLVYCAGKLVLANLIPDSVDTQTQVGFVYLDEASRQWQPLATMPREIMPAELKKLGCEQAICMSGV